MKNITFLGSFLLAGVLFCPLLTKADVIPENSHPLDRCVMVVNLDKFTDVALIGFVTGPMVNKYDSYQIKNNECLTKGYKFNTFSIYWTTKDKFESLDLKNIKLKTEKVKTNAYDKNGNPMYSDAFTPSDLSLLADNLEPYGGYVNNNNPLSKEVVEYSIIKSADGKYSLNKTKTVSDYNNGNPEKIEKFNIDQDVKDTNTSITKSLKMGLRNDLQVKHLQSVLNKLLGLSLSSDGSFGVKTKNAVIAFQKTKGLTPDGIVGPKTISELNKIPTE